MFNPGGWVCGSLSDSEKCDFQLAENNQTNVYKREGTDVGVGSFASVMKVRELDSGKCFAAKVPHFKASDAPGKVRDRWESLSKEFQKFTTLKHVNGAYTRSLNLRTCINILSRLILWRPLKLWQGETRLSHLG